MAWITPALSVVGTIMQVGSALAGARAEKITASRVAAAKESEAKQAEIAAQEQVAAAQRHAFDEQRRARLVASRALAVAGASGAGASDPTVVNLLADLEGEGAYRAALATYEGEERARQFKMGAGASRYEGQVAIEGGRLGAAALRTRAVGALISGGAGLYEKYGMGGPKKASAPGSLQPAYNYDFDDPRFN